MTRNDPLGLTPWMERWGMFPPEGGTILCALSGGEDSTCLLDCLWQLGQARGFTVAAGHLNHLMRPTAQRDEDFVKALCQERNIPLYTRRTDVTALAERENISLEEAGRQARYDFLHDTADDIGAAFIATAHHREDQAETVLLQLLRGTGTQGLTGIPPVRGRIIRPLLDTDKASITAYLEERGIGHVFDETNDQRTYARNRLRLDIMPQLLDINPALAAHICRTADILRGENELLDDLARQRLPQDGTAVETSAFASAPEPLRRRMARLLVERLPIGKKDFTARHYDALVRLAETGGSLSLPYGASAVCADGVLTLFLKAPPPEETPLTVGDNRFGTWRVTVSEAPLAGAMAVRRLPLTVRTWQRDDRMRLPESRGQRSLKRLMADGNIPLSQRETWPVVCADGRPIALWQVGIDESVLPESADSALYITISTYSED